MRPRSDKGGGHFPSMPCASLAPAPLAASLARVVGVVVPDATEQADLLPPDAENRQQWQIRDVPRAAARANDWPPHVASSVLHARGRMRLVAFCCVVIMLGVADAATVTVPGMYPSIQAAVQNAPDGSIIEVAPGHYHGQVVLENDTRSLTLRGDPANPSTVVIDRPATRRTGVTHATRGSPSTSTVQQPHCPWGLQPSLADRTSSGPRNASSRLGTACPASSRASPRKSYFRCPVKTPNIWRSTTSPSVASRSRTNALPTPTP